MRPLLALAIVLATTAASAAERAVEPAVEPAVEREVLDARFRLGADAGAAWFGTSPGDALGAAGGLRLRLQASDRLLFGLGLAHVAQHFGEGRWFRSTLVPLTVGLRIDRAPVSPYLAGGGALVVLPVDGGYGLSSGAVLEAGLEIALSRRLAATVQATYAGLNASDVPFPFYSALTAGLEASL